MKRSPLTRRTGLARGVTELRRTELSRGTAQLTRTAPIQPGRGTPTAAPVRALIAIRSEGRCEGWRQTGTGWVRCADAGVDPQHRITRARGGQLLDRTVHAWFNTAFLCRADHRLSDDGAPGTSNPVRVLLPGWRLQPGLAAGTLHTQPDGTVGYCGPDTAYQQVVNGVAEAAA